MIERQFITQKIKEYQIQEFIAENIKRAGLSHTSLKRTPLGEKILIYTSRPGLVVGKKGANIKKITAMLKKKYNLENPQIETVEVQDVYLDPHIVAEIIANSFERFGSARFKGVGHQTLSKVMEAGAIGIEIVISGKIPSSRAKSWRFYAGYLKKSGDIAMHGVQTAMAQAQLKTGVVGIKVKILPANVVLPDKIKLLAQPVFVQGPAKEGAPAVENEGAEEKAKEEPKKERHARKKEKADKPEKAVKPRKKKAAAEVKDDKE